MQPPTHPQATPPSRDATRPRRALVSDIHANLEALQAVLADIEQQGVTEIYCLGDTVGYGPNPLECVDLLSRFHIVLLGNHDQGVLFDPPNWSPSAERAIFWTREQLERSGSESVRDRRWEMLSSLPRTHRDGKMLHVHGSPRNPINEYIFPEDIYNLRKMTALFSLVELYCFQGHTHVPGVFVEQAASELFEFRSPDEIAYTWQFDGRKTMVNVGSVGQPRDGDWRSCYVLLDGDTIQFRRVEYDVDTTVGKIYDVPELDNFLGDRLRQGR